ncbi:MAG TPA: hypothetical protein VN985_08565 [Candidatus Eisenbacteria bacterium]|nr:hypothetical protein [Candidatus Eisenbacteria bacterium]
MDSGEVVLLVTVALLVVYVIGIGGATATAIRVSEAWRRRPVQVAGLGPRTDGELVLQAPALPSVFRRVRVVGWVVFPFALSLAVFANGGYVWIAPLAVLVMVGLNAFYFTAMQGLGEPLTLANDGFRYGAKGKERSVRWIHVTDLAGARLGAFSGVRMSEAGEWQDPRLRPNVIFFRLNRALVHTPKTLLQRLRGFSYYDGAIRNAFGVPTEQLLQAMREWQRVAVDAESPPFRRPRPGESRSAP